MRLVRREEGRRGYGGLAEVKEVCRTMAELAKLLSERKTRGKNQKN